jgi:hypothetical protein
MNHYPAITLLAALTGALGTGSASAGDPSVDAAIGGALGGGAGAFLGSELGGREGAILGGALGGATGAAITTNRPREPRDVYVPYYPAPAPYYAPPRRGHFCPPGQAKKGRC